VPFDNDVAACTQFIVTEESRPVISQIKDEDDEESSENEESDDESQQQRKCTKPIADIIRKCWVSDPSERPSFNWVIEQLTKEIGFYSMMSNMDNMAVEDGEENDLYNTNVNS